MTDRIVINTGPLVLLARADLLDVVGELPLQFVSPDEVRDEISAGVAQGYPDIAPQWLTTMALQNPIDAVALATLDSGEAAVIQLATEHEKGSAPGEIASDLPYPFAVGIHSNPSDVNHASLKLHHEKDRVANSAEDPQDFDSEEITGAEAVPMGAFTAQLAARLPGRLDD